MRFEATPPPVPLPAAPRRVERPAGEVVVTAPVAWPSARVEAWLDWAARLPGDWPVLDPTEALRADQPFDPLLGEGPDRHARRLAAWGLALGHFRSADEAEAWRAREASLKAALEAARNDVARLQARASSMLDYAPPASTGRSSTPFRYSQPSAEGLVMKPVDLFTKSGLPDRRRYRGSKEAFQRNGEWYFWG